MKSTWSLVVAAGVIIGGLVFLSSTSKQPPFIPADDLHKNITAQEGCVPCHGPGTQAPLKANHPPKEQCLVCHKTGSR